MHSAVRPQVTGQAAATVLMLRVSGAAGNSSLFPITAFDPPGDQSGGS